MDIKKTIENYAKEKGFIAGFCDIDTTSILDTAKSAIIIGVGYGKKERVIVDDIPRGRLASYAVGPDYHISIRIILSELRDYLHKLGILFDSHIHVDSGPLPERLLALKAGIGRLGKNQCVFSKEFGSFFNIGCMLVSIPLHLGNSTRPILAASNVVSHCGNCIACIIACPTGALTENGYDCTKCISYITQKRGTLQDWEQQAIGHHLFGCDICQTMCPKNTGKHVGEITDINEIMPPLESILSMTKSKFKERYGNTAMYWRGLQTVKRNALAVLNNFYKKGDN